MPQIVKPYQYNNGQLIDANQLDANLDTLYSAINGNLDGSNLKTGLNVDINGVIDVKSPAYNASGSALSTTGSITSGSFILTLTAALDFVNGQGISIVGAGAAGATLVTSIANGAGTTQLTLNTVASTTVTSVAINHEDTASLQAAINQAVSLGKDEVIMPHGTYRYGVLTSTAGISFIGDGVTLVGTTVLNLISLAALQADVVQRGVNIKSAPYNALGAGTDDTAAFVAANSALAATGGEIFVPDGTYLLTSKFTTSPNVHLLLSPGAILKRGVNGYILNLGIKSSLKGGEVDANAANFTGDLLQINTGTNVAGSEGLQVIEDVNFNNFDTYAINYDTVNTGFLSKINRCNFVPYNNTAVAVKWPNETTTGGNRSIQHCYSACPLVDLNGCDNGIITGNTVGVQVGDARASLVFSASPKKVIITGNRFAHGTNLLTFLGSDHVINNNEISSLVAFDLACVNVKYSEINTDSGFSGTVPFKTNYIYTRDDISYTTVWTATGTAPAFGNADVRASYTVRGRKCKVKVSIRFGTTSTYGTGSWSFTLPLATATTSWNSGSAFVGDRSGSAVSRVDQGTVVIYVPAGGTANVTTPIAWGSTSTLAFEMEYNLA